MAELLVRTVDKPLSGDPYIDRHRSVAGSVIVIVEDGHEWSKAEMASEEWRIVKVPGVKPSLLTQFTARDLGYGDPEAEKLDRVLRRYPVKVDIDALDIMLADPVKVDDMKKRPVRALALILALNVARPVLKDPAIIGAPIKRFREFG